MQITFHETQLHLEVHPEYEFLLTNKEVALGYGITANTLTKHKTEHTDELIEGKHWIKQVSATNGGNQKVIHWTKKGIVRLGFFIKSKEAKEFRDWAEDYIVNATPTQTDEVQKLQQTILEQNELLASRSTLTPTTNATELRELQKENALLKAKLEQAHSPDAIWNLVNNGLKYKELQERVRGIVPLLT